MHIDKKDLKDNLELYLGGIFAMLTVVIVIMNVFTRYVLSFTYFWAEEISVACFVWTIFLGAAGAFRQKKLMGVDIIVQVAKGKTRRWVELINAVLLFVITASMCFMSSIYVIRSNKITAALEISYRFITISIVIAFFLMTIYSLMFLVQRIKYFNKPDDPKKAIEQGAD